MKQKAMKFKINEVNEEVQFKSITMPTAQNEVMIFHHFCALLLIREMEGEQIIIVAI
jgi:hypothetical protein